MKLKTIDGEQYLDRISKVFFKDDVIPEEYQDKTKYDVFVLDSNRPKRVSNLELYKVINDNQMKYLGFFDDKESIEEYIGQDLIETLLPTATYIVLHKGGFVGCFTK